MHIPRPRRSMRLPLNLTVEGRAEERDDAMEAVRLRVSKRKCCSFVGAGSEPSMLKGRSVMLYEVVIEGIRGQGQWMSVYLSQGCLRHLSRGSKPRQCGKKLPARKAPPETWTVQCIAAVSRIRCGGQVQQETSAGHDRESLTSSQRRGHSNATWRLEVDDNKQIFGCLDGT